jgi:cytochrome c-type biogenesis protein CcsB
MESSQLLSIVTFVYGLACFLYLTAFIFDKPGIGTPAVWTAILGAGGNIAGIIMRWVESYKLGIGHAPLSNLYESLVFFAAALTIIHLVVEHQYNNRFIGAFATPIAFLTMAYASFAPNKTIQPLIPALKSNWLIAHVITCFFGYAGFAIAFGISLVYLLKESGIGQKKGLRTVLPQTAILDQLTHQMITFGFLFLTIGIITGAVWANSAWGSYWSWDPKETWSLITWLIYATLLHARFARGWSGKRVAWLSIIGFMAVMFTYFGVNLLPGLHSYGAA